MTEKKMLLPTDSQQRKAIPITEGVLDYFPLAIAEVAKCSHAGNEQHHPGSKLHWDKSKSTDHANCIGRHLIDRGTFDTDGVRHSAKLAWRALALLQTELEELQQEKYGVESIAESIEESSWIQWGGGSIPVPAEVEVEYRMRGYGSEVYDDKAVNLRWWWVSSTVDTEYFSEEADIVAYRVVNEK